MGANHLRKQNQDCRQNLAEAFTWNLKTFDAFNSQYLKTLRANLTLLLVYILSKKITSI